MLDTKPPLNFRSSLRADVQFFATVRFMQEAEDNSNTYLVLLKLIQQIVAGWRYAVSEFLPVHRFSYVMPMSRNNVGLQLFR